MSLIMHRSLQRHHTFASFSLSLFSPLLLLLVLAGCDSSDRDDDRSDRVKDIEHDSATVDDNGAVSPPKFGGYPASQVEIQGWIDAVNLAAIRKHAWDIWGSITSPSGEEGLPVWETWYSGDDLFNSPGDSVLGQSDLHSFESPQQFHHHSTRGVTATIPTNASEQVSSFNRYSPSVANFIWDHRLNRASHLDSINEAFDRNGTPVVDRQVLTSAGPVDPAAIVLKPVFQFISGTEPTVIPYWDGISPETSINLANPTPDTWRQGVVVDPTGKLTPGSHVWMSVNKEPADSLLVVSLDDFFHFTLTKEEAEAYSNFAETSGDDVGKGNRGDSASVAAMVKEGNIALLMAMHVTSKEIPNWTWQTFWWGANPDDAEFGHDRPASIPAPWSHYNMRTAYFMVTPPDAKGGDPYVSFNPYLETNLAGTVDIGGGRNVKWTGVNSNCMTCHRLAAWKQNPGGNGPKTPDYQPDGFIDPADSSLFGGYTKLDFLWSLTRAE